MSELEKEILEIINCEIEGEYIGKLKVREEEYWKNYPCDQNPCKKGVIVNIAGEGTPEQVFADIVKELDALK